MQLAAIKSGINQYSFKLYQKIFLREKIIPLRATVYAALRGAQTKTLSKPLK